MNDVLGLINVEILAEEDRPESWKVKDGYSLFRYYDGIVSGKRPSPLTSRILSLCQGHQRKRRSHKEPSGVHKESV